MMSKQEPRKDFAFISKIEFLTLHNVIWQKFIEENRIDSKLVLGGKSQPQTKFYPTRSDEADSMNLVEHMRKPNTLLARYLEEKGWKPNGKKLYDYLVEANKIHENETPFQISKEYLKIYLLYVDCADLEEFSVKHIQKRTVYTGVQYFVRHREVLTFEMTIDLSQSPCKASVKGYWSLFKDREYHGEGHFVENTGLYFALTDGKTGYFYLIIHIKSLEEMNDPFVIGRSLTSSSWVYPISSEIFLVNKSIANVPSQMLKIKRFFHLKRPSQRTINREYGGNLDKLKIRNIKPNDFQIMTGCFRTWVYNSEGKILQQKFIVEEDYKSYLKRKTKNIEGNDRDTLFCFLALNEKPSKRILVSIYPVDANTLIGYTILHNFKPGVEYIYGAYINVGDESRPPAHHAVILRHEPNPDVFEPEVFDVSGTAFKSVLDDPKLLKMKECLDLLEVNNYKGLSKIINT